MGWWGMHESCEEDCVLHASRSLVLVVVLAVGFRAEAQTVPLELSHPDGPDRAEIDFTEHNHWRGPYTAKLSLYRSRPYVRVIAYGETYWRGLDEEDLRGIDALLAYYRSGPQLLDMRIAGHSTTMNVSWYRGDDEVGSEEFLERRSVPRSLEYVDGLRPEQRVWRIVSIQDLLERAGARLTARR